MIRVKDLPENELYYTSHLAFFEDDDGGLWVNGNYRCVSKMSFGRTIEIIHTVDGLIHVRAGALNNFSLKRYTGQPGYFQCCDPYRIKKTEEKKSAKDPGFRYL